jgi:hypothetical protein
MGSPTVREAQRRISVVALVSKEACRKQCEVGLEVPCRLVGGWEELGDRGADSKTSVVEDQES